MPRVQCLDCRRVISGYELRSYSIEYAYCERCFWSRMHKTESKIKGFQDGEVKVKEVERRLATLAKRVDFLSSWNTNNNGVPELSDVVFKAPDGSEVHAHKAVLAGKSPVFKAMFGSPMKEAETGVVIIDDGDTCGEVLKALVGFFYTATIPPGVMEKHSASLFRMADKYGITYLKSICEEFIANTVSKENAISSLELGRKYTSKVVMDAVLQAASHEMDKIHTYVDYATYVEKDPKLLVELYEGVLDRICRKRSRPGEYCLPLNS